MAIQNDYGRFEPLCKGFDFLGCGAKGEGPGKKVIISRFCSNSVSGDVWLEAYA